MQGFVYEILVHLGPFWSALLAGFIVIVYGKTYLTCAGETYLSRQEVER